jgi:hypothetical protein
MAIAPEAIETIGSARIGVLVLAQRLTLRMLLLLSSSTGVGQLVPSSSAM